MRLTIRICPGDYTELRKEKCQPTAEKETSDQLRSIREIFSQDKPPANAVLVRSLLRHAKQ